MLELMEPECESKLVALALQHLAQGWVATEENCDLDEKRASKFTPSICFQTKKLLLFCLNFLIFTIFCLAQHLLRTISHLANLLLSDLCKHLAKIALKN